ncbi:hypothetical protein HH110_08795 [Stenotrophomonas sp. SAM-B]|uniref:hypothetical protein n=1 Tax=Stenotrophomonas sp. SAM-B TaxID=2729141 RepID=UPI0015A34897|nr:hypothetical protein [Stenotrophomonas sp. SAM-B]NWF33142.1 hypothetical protein [Stenotrophomonas sp. SAM-B]
MKIGGAEMTKRRIVELLVSPWFLAPLCFGSGAGLAVAILGVPLLWTPEAAGWASAIGTSAAAIVALVVGVVPEINRRREMEIKSFAQMHVTESSLETQLLHVSVAIEHARQEFLDAAARRAIFAAMEKFDPMPVAALLNFPEHLGPGVLGNTSRCVVDMNRVDALMRTFRSVPSESVIEGGEWLTGVLVSAYLSMDDARSAYSVALGRKPSRLPEVPAEVIAARAANE